MRIKSIEISNVKGIGFQKFDLDLEPNKPNLLVAPNGFGKSSFGIAFDSLKRDKIELDKKHIHKKDSKNLPSLKLEVTSSKGALTLLANSNSNNITNIFDVVVINSPLRPKAQLFKISGINITSAYLEIEPIVLLSTIPNKVEFGYKLSNEKKAFGDNGKIISDISELLNCSTFLSRLDKEISFSKLTGKKLNKVISDAVIKTQGYKGTAGDLKINFEKDSLNTLKEFEELNNLAGLISQIKIESLVSEVDYYLAAIQIVSLYNSLGNDFKKALNYSLYLNEKADLIDTIDSVNTTRFTIKPDEHKKKGLIIEWPQGHEISNGERDVLSLIILLIKSRKSFSKNNGILIIDEIFDYLDDANLVAFQYFVTNFIEKMIDKGKNIFPILMTHLDPMVFNQFCFNKHKLKVHYLQSVNNFASKELLKIIYNREEELVKENLSKHFFHFFPTDIDLTTDFEALGLNKDWADSAKFRKRNFRQLRAYLIDNTEYDPIAVCLAIRYHIEKLVYELLNNPDLQTEFIATKTTKEKLEYSARKGIRIPEILFLLGIVYNSPLHLNQGQDISVPLSLKMENKTIKKMINEVFN